MISPTGIIPENLMYPERKQDVVDFLIAQPYPGDFKKQLLTGWARTVDVRCESRDFQLVEASGYDGVNYGRNY